MGLEVFANSSDSKRLVNLYSPARSLILCLLIAHGPYIVCGNSKCLNVQAGLGIYCFHMHLAPFCMLQLKYHQIIFFKRSVLFLCKFFVYFYIFSFTLFWFETCKHVIIFPSTCQHSVFVILLIFFKLWWFC